MRHHYGDRQPDDCSASACFTGLLAKPVQCSQAAAAPSDAKPVPPDNPDRVGEELADDAKIWHIYDQVAKEDDERRTKAWDNGLNNLALFAGLFSAVTTAFIIEAQQDMEPDYAQLTFLVLNASVSGEKFVQQPFTVPSGARTVNCLWVASLVLSLSAALIAIMGKDWIGMYTARPVCNLRQWAEMRSYRLNCVEQWYMSGVIAAAPVLLHISLLLFGAGLVLFISSDPLTHHLTLGLSLAAGVLYLVTTFSAVVFSTSPFKSPATQMIRAALSALFLFLRSLIYRPKRNVVGALLRDINKVVVGRADDTALLPGSGPEIRRSLLRLHPLAALASAGRTAITYMGKIPTSVRIVRRNLHWSRVQSQLHSVVSAIQRLSLDDWFLSSTWTDLPADRRPNLLADAMSWLSGASQSPDVFRAIVFALGDLDVGPMVGMHVSLALRTRLRTEIRRTGQQVDFLTISRYVLAERNFTPGDAALDSFRIMTRFLESNEPAPRCEDGLPARVKVLPAYISPDGLRNHFPGPSRVTQPRMVEFLLPYIQQTKYDLPAVLIIVAHRYRTHIRAGDSFSSRNLEAHLYRSLDADTREKYAAEVNDRYGGTAGAIELLTFLCHLAELSDTTKAAAIELLMQLLEDLPSKEHRCLAYLFGSNELWHVAWQDKHWSLDSLWMLSGCLRDSRRHPFQPSSARTQADDRQFDLALARTSVMLLSSPHHPLFGDSNIVFLFDYLRQSPPLDNAGKLNVIRLILESAALLRIAGMPEYFTDNTVHCGTAILADIISELGRHLREVANGREAEKLFQALAFTEVKGENGDSRTWDLGEWLLTQAPENLKRSPFSATAMQSVHDALIDIYPLCTTNDELRTQWDRIGYPGRPDDIFSDPFLDVGAFFENAGAPRAHPGDPIDDPWFDLTEFFDGAEEGKYRWPDMDWESMGF